MSTSVASCDLSTTDSSAEDPELFDIGKLFYNLLFNFDFLSIFKRYFCSSYISQAHINSDLYAFINYPIYSTS